MSKKRVLLTGGSGFIGANLARRLLLEGHEVHLLLRPCHNPWRIRSNLKDMRIHIVELTDECALRRIVRKIKPDWVFHLATNGAYSWQNNVQNIIQTNIQGTYNLLDACLKSDFEALINTGSSSEYGFKNYPPKETEYLLPNSFYAVTKASATLLCSFMAQKTNKHIVTLRLYSAYGPYEEPMRFVPTLLVHGMHHRFPALVAPHTARDFIYIEDIENAYLLAASVKKQEPGVVYNVGTGVQTTIRDAVSIACKEFGIKTKPKWGSMPNRQWDQNIWVANPCAIKKTLGWHPKYTFHDGFHKTWEWLHLDICMRAFYENKILKNHSR